MCQFRHDMSLNDECENSLGNFKYGSGAQKMTYENSEAMDIFCEKYCADENDIHIHDSKSYQMYRGIDIFQHENVCRCKVNMNGKICDFDSAFIDEHMEHYEEDHMDVDDTIKCKKLEESDFKADIPEDMITHIRYHR